MGNGATFAPVGELSFIAPGGFLLLLADELPGADHLHFKLPSSGGSIQLYDQAGVELDRRAYPALGESVSYGRLPDGVGSWRVFVGTSSPAASNYVAEYFGPVINEILASNPTGMDWVELFNPSETDYDLSGMSLSVNRQKPGEWVFGTGTVVPAGGYLILECDPRLSAGGTITPEGKIGPALNSSSGGAYLYNAGGQLVEWIEYGAQVPGHSIGRTESGWVMLNSVSPGLENSAAALVGTATSLRINEWMAAPLLGDDWFEIYNPSDLPVDLGGLFVTDDPSLHGRTNTRIASLSYIAPRGFVLFQADGEVEQGRDHVNFSLSTDGEMLRLYSPTLAIMDEIYYAPQVPGVAEGRFPDGGMEVALFPGTATPGSANVAAGNDADGDGMPDEWEVLHGLDPAVPDADLDLDGDGLSNGNEFVAGTNPGDPASILALMAHLDVTGNIVLNLSAAAGRSYTVFYTEDLLSGEWQRLENIEATADSRMVQVIDPGGGKSRFYKIVTPLQP